MASKKVLIISGYFIKLGHGGYGSYPGGFGGYGGKQIKFPKISTN